MAYQDGPRDRRVNNIAAETTVQGKGEQLACVKFKCSVELFRCLKASCPDADSGLGLLKKSESYRHVFEECAKRTHWSCLASCQYHRKPVASDGEAALLKLCISECQTKICRNSHPVRTAREDALVEQQVGCLNEHCLKAHKACMLKRCLAK